MFDMMTTRVVDALGLVQAEIAALQVKAETYRAQIAAEGVGAYEGRFYRDVVSTYVRKTLSIKIARAKLKALGVATRWFRDHTVEKDVTVVDCTARTGHNLLKQAA